MRSGDADSSDEKGPQLPAPLGREAFGMLFPRLAARETEAPFDRPAPITFVRSHGNAGAQPPGRYVPTRDEIFFVRRLLETGMSAHAWRATYQPDLSGAEPGEGEMRRMLGRRNVRILLRALSITRKGYSAEDLAHLIAVRTIEGGLSATELRAYETIARLRGFLGGPKDERVEKQDGARRDSAKAVATRVMKLLGFDPRKPIVSVDGKEGPPGPESGPEGG